MVSIFSATDSVLETDMSRSDITPTTRPTDHDHPTHFLCTEGQALKGTYGSWVARGLLWTSQPLALEQVSKNDSGQ